MGVGRLAHPLGDPGGGARDERQPDLPVRRIGLLDLVAERGQPLRERDDPRPYVGPQPRGQRRERRLQRKRDP
jgi:hypothetical protein